MVLQVHLYKIDRVHRDRRHCLRTVARRHRRGGPGRRPRPRWYRSRQRRRPGRPRPRRPRTHRSPPPPRPTTAPPAPPTHAPSTRTGGTLTTTTTSATAVANQPNIDALSPHIVALQGAGVQYQSSSGVADAGTTPNVPSFLSSPGGPYLYDAKGRVVLIHGVNVVYKHAPYIAYPDPGEPWNFERHRCRENAAAGLQRRASRDRVAGARAGIGRAQPAPDLHAREPRATPTNGTGPLPSST